MSITEASKKWGISNRRIQTLCAQERIPGAARIASVWAIPIDAEKPADARVKSGKYIKNHCDCRTSTLHKEKKTS